VNVIFTVKLMLYVVEVSHIDTSVDCQD